MSGAAQTSAKMKIKKKSKRNPFDISKLQRHFEGFVSSSHPGVEIGLQTVFGTVQGGTLGYLMSALLQNSAQTMKQAGANATNPMIAQMPASAKTPWGQARGLAALCGVSSGISTALKKIRGKDDVWTQMAAAAGGGAAFTIANGNCTIPAVVNSALVLGLFTGAFSKVMEAVKPQHDEKEFERSKYMLQSLGLSKYDRNIRRGQLTDNTIMLWTERALQEVKIPPGPRLLIMHHIDQFRRNEKRLDPPPKPGPAPVSPPTKSPALDHPHNISDAAAGL